MPTINYYRTWCKTCNDWTLHERLIQKEPMGSGDDICFECDTIFTSIKLSEIPEQKLIEQRKRYEESKQRNIQDVYFRALSGGNSNNSFFSSFPERKIIENDAGQKTIDENQKQSRVLYAQKQNDLKIEYVKYKRLNRNDICLCGSGKKYKKCCLEKFKVVI